MVDMLNWFNAKDAVAFAEELANEYHSLFPAGGLKETGKAQQKQSRQLERLVERAITFSKSQRLNVYKKAKFFAAFKFRLKALGHADEDTQRITRALLPYM